MPRTFAIRLTCSYGDADYWVTLPNRDETLEQILQQSWDFKCRAHGPQREIPIEVIEVAPRESARSSSPSQPSQYDSPTVVPVATPIAPPVAPKRKLRSSTREFTRIPVVVYGWTSKCGTFQEETETIVVNSSGALVVLKTQLEVGDSVFLIHKGSRAVQDVRVASVEPASANEAKVGLAFRHPALDFWKGKRKTPRVPKTLRVVVKGGDAKGDYFIQTAYTVDLSQEGARLDGVGLLTTPGQIIEVRRLWRKAKFRVVWTGNVGTAESNHVGVFRLQSDKDIWHVALPDSEAAEPPKKPTRPKK
jgi:hypothetical protein